MRQRWIFSFIVAITMLLMFTGCVREQPRIIVITATFLPQINPAVEITPIAAAEVPATSAPISFPPPDVTLVLSPVPQQAASNPTPNATRPPVEIPSQHKDHFPHHCMQSNRQIWNSLADQTVSKSFLPYKALNKLRLL